MNNHVFLQVMSPVSVTKDFSTLHYYTSSSTPVSPSLRCKQMEKGGKKRVK